ETHQAENVVDHRRLDPPDVFGPSSLRSETLILAARRPLDEGKLFSVGVRGSCRAKSPRGSAGASPSQRPLRRVLGGRGSGRAESPRGSAGASPSQGEGGRGADLRHWLASLPRGAHLTK